MAPLPAVHNHTGDTREEMVGWASHSSLSIRPSASCPPTFGAQPQGPQAAAPELRVVDLDGHRVWSVVRVLERKFKEFNSAQRGVERVSDSDGPVEGVGDALGLGTLSVGRHHLQVSGVLGQGALPGLQWGRSPW